MSDKEIAENVSILFGKGLTSDYSDTVFFWNATEGDIARAYEMLAELQAHGSIKFSEKYGL